MGGEAWALVGVIVGALMAGAWQLLGGSLDRRHQHVTRLREAQRDAYVKAMRHLNVTAAVRLDGPALSDIAEAKGLRAKWADYGPDMWRMRRDLRTARAGVTDVWELTAELRLVAPVDTYEAGRDALLIAYYQTLGQMLSKEFRDEHEHLFYDQRDEFVRLAKRDLGVPPDERPVRPVDGSEEEAPPS
jgi:hypothetical protein